jgi:tetratricopeptide (TPR) repeat protein
MRPDYADAQTNLAIADLALSNFASGKRETDAAIALATRAVIAAGVPNQAFERAQYYRGLIEQVLDSPPAAGAKPIMASVADLSAVVRSYPRLPNARRELGISSFLAGKSAASRSSFEALLAQDPNDLLGNYYLAVLYRRLGLMRLASDYAYAYESEKPALGTGAIALVYLRDHPEFRPESVAGHVHIQPGIIPKPPPSSSGSESNRPNAKQK